MGIFEYSLLQYVGDPARQEALNVAVVVMDPTTSEARVFVDPFARMRLRPIWREFKNSDLFPLVRDIRRTVGAEHQQFLEEASVPYSAQLSALDAIVDSSANRFRLTERKSYSATSLQMASAKLYERFVAHPQGRVRRDRHMTRATLRNMMAGIFREWSARLPEPLVVATDESIQGALAPHTVDMVAYDGDSPEYLFFAAPLSGQDAPLIRDSLPTAMTDIGIAFPNAKQFVVIGDEGSDPTDPDGASVTTRAILRKAPGEVLSYSEFKRQFGEWELVASS